MSGLLEELMVTSQFGIDIDGVTIASFQKVSGLEIESEICEHTETANGVIIIKKVPGSRKWSDIELARCIDGNRYLSDWRKQIDEGNLAEGRRTGSIVAFDSMLEEVARWNFINGWPSKISFAEFDASANEVAVETVTIAHEGIERV